MSNISNPRAETLYGFPQPINRQNPSPIKANRSPTTSDTGYPLGQIWVNKASAVVYILAQIQNGAATWNISAAAAGDLDTLTGDAGGVITPVSNNIDLLGTANEIVTTGTAGTITWSLADPMVIPGALTVTGLLTCLASATIDTAGTALGLGIDNDSAAINVGLGTTARAIHIGDSAAAHVLTLGSTTAASGTTISVGTGNFSLAGAATSTMTIGSVAQTGTITLGRSTAGQQINISGAINTGAQIVEIANGASAADTTVRIMSGNATAGTQLLNLAPGS